MGETQPVLMYPCRVARPCGCRIVNIVQDIPTLVVLPVVQYTGRRHWIVDQAVRIVNIYTQADATGSWIRPKPWGGGEQVHHSLRSPYRPVSSLC